MFHWLNVSNMKIDHRGRKSSMAEAFLYIQKTLTILKQMACGTMAQGMDGDGMVKTGLHQGILQYDSDISGFDGLWCNVSAMSLEYEVFTRIVPFVDAKQEQLLFRNGDTAVFLALALINEYLLTIKADVIPFEAANLANPESAVIDGGKQGLVIQVTETDEPFYLLLREHAWKPFGLADTR